MWNLYETSGERKQNNEHVVCCYVGGRKCCEVRMHLLASSAFNNKSGSENF